MRRRQFHVLYREFLFRMVDVESLSTHAQGDSNKLLGRFASLLVFASLLFSLPAWFFAGSTAPTVNQLMMTWAMQHFLISTTMLAVGVFAVLSWDSTFPSRREVMVLGPLPVHGSTLFLAKVAAVATALALTVAALHVFTGLLWPIAFAQARAEGAPALTYLPALPSVKAADMDIVLNADLAASLRTGALAPATGSGAAIGILDHGARHVLTYGTAKRDSVFEIGSISKVFTGLLLAQMASQEKVSLWEPVRELLPPGTVNKPPLREINLLDLATHHAGLPRMPDNLDPADPANPLADYGPRELYEFVAKHGVGRDQKTEFLYTNLGYALLGQALAERANASYPDLLRSEIAAPLGMKDTVVALSPEQQSRLLQGHNPAHRPVRPWDTDVFAGAGGIRSTADDMLTFLDAQLHPEKASAVLAGALHDSHWLHSDIGRRMPMALAWAWDPEARIYWASGGTGGFSSYTYFDPKRDQAAIVLLNTSPGPTAFFELLGTHVRQRLAGQPAVSLDAVAVPGQGGLAGIVRSFAAYWITMLTAGAFIYCCVLSLQGIAAQVLPRRWFLRVSSLLQLSTFCAFVCGYFLQHTPQYALVAGQDQPLLAWVPSYWFVGLFQQLNGTLHPALAPLAQRAWAGVAIAGGVTALAYTLSYLRTVRQVMETPDIVPGIRGGSRLPSFGDAQGTAVVQFSIRSLLRSRQHRMMLAFYLGVGFALSMLLLQMPVEQQVIAQAAETTNDVSLPLMAASVVMMGFTVIGMRVLFAMPLDLRSNWVFRVTPFRAGTECLKARRRAFLVLAVGPVWIIFTVVLFWLWPARYAAGHSAVLGLIGLILVEICLHGAHKIPFTCSYLPGKANFSVTVLLCSMVVYPAITEGALQEIRALETVTGTAILVAALAAIWLVTRWHSGSLALAEGDEAKFEETPADEVLSLNLSRNTAG
jgi:CubicO group peptidase (beta-lactamase class C family)